MVDNNPQATIAANQQYFNKNPGIFGAPQQPAQPAQPQNPWVLPPSTPATPAASGSSGSTGQGSQIISSMLGPAYQNFTAALGSAYGQNQNMLPSLPAGTSYTITPQGQIQATGPNGTYTPMNLGTAGTAIQATDQSALASIAAQVQQGQNQLSQQYTQTEQQSQNAQGAIDVALARSGPGANTDVGGVNYKASVAGQFATALNQIQQAQSLLSLQGTADEMAANATAANSLMTAAQNQINNTMQLAQASLTASSQMAQSTLQAQTFDLQVQQYQDQVKQNQEYMQQQQQQFTEANGINTKFYSTGGQVLDSATGQPINPQDYPEGIKQSEVTPVQPTAITQQIANMASSYPDAAINPLTDTIASASKKILNSRIYQAAVTSIGSGVGSVKVPTAIAKYLSPQVNTNTYDDVQGVLQTVIGSSGINIDYATPEQRYQMWGQVASQIDAAGKNPQSPLYGLSANDFNALLWATFQPPQTNSNGQTLDGLAQYILQHPSPTASQAYKGTLPGGSTARQTGF